MSIPIPESTAFAATATSSTAAAPEPATDKQMFLELLVAQLRYQDPLNPTDSADFLAQTAQFSTLESIQQLTSYTGELLASQLAFGASALVGRKVSYADSDGETVSGTVEQVTFGSTGPRLTVDGVEVSINDLISVSNDTTTPTGA
ncbi:flagellar hook capping protein [Aeromicrobium phragmitis]|uniref:Flagellar hook capping protein n=1 Tax=Aeromicrobium phragmitis TaxID=2478914 RepID=A0A3L8PR21_9ACTN|nr:flagellar hook capping FlgD N-terminal domain-containing protein [Aeromicrobium phragmitis]RLV56472.1 flagellar hook capping protein [Aeromicrobium phragmitis]